MMLKWWKAKLTWRVLSARQKINRFQFKNYQCLNIHREMQLNVKYNNQYNNNNQLLIKLLQSFHKTHLFQTVCMTLKLENIEFWPGIWLVLFL